MKDLISKLNSFDATSLKDLDNDSFIQFKNAIDMISARLDNCSSYTDTLILSNPVLDTYSVSHTRSIFTRGVFESVLNKELELFEIRSFKAGDVNKVLPKSLFLATKSPFDNNKVIDKIVWGYENGKLTFKGVSNEGIDIEATFNVTIS